MSLVMRWFYPPPMNHFHGIHLRNIRQRHRSHELVAFSRLYKMPSILHQRKGINKPLFTCHLPHLKNQDSKRSQAFGAGCDILVPTFAFQLLACHSYVADHQMPLQSCKGFLRNIHSCNAFCMDTACTFYLPSSTPHKFRFSVPQLEMCVQFSPY